MANVNVNRNVDDAFYRYKMPRIIAKVEGKGNGIKTVIVNMTDVAKALSRPPTYPTKYFGCELGAQTQFDTKNDRYIVNGSHDSGKLQDLLDGFIKRFVLCQECDNPETNLHVLQKKGMISQRCIACGHQFNVDMRHKLTTYILKNPPDQVLYQDLSAATPSKTKKDKKKEKKGKGEVNGTDDQDDKTHRLSSKDEEEEDDDDWGEDTSAAAVQRRMEELSNAAKDMMITVDSEKPIQARIDIFYAFVKDKKETSQLLGAEQEKDILAKAEQLDIKDKAPMILAELLYDTNILTQVPKYHRLFLRFTRQNPKAQKYLLGGFEQLVGNVHKDVLIPKVPHILKAFYDHDLLEEEVLIDWDKKASKKYVSKEVSKDIHTKASPFVKWLQEAEEESSDEDDDEEEVEVVYSHTEKVGTQAIPKETANKADEEDDDDLNIDDI